MKKTGFTLTNISMLVVVQLLLLNSFNTFAQEDFGDDPDKCKESISLYREYYKQKNYQDAILGWRWAFAHCPKATKNIVINGPTIIEFQIEKYKDNAEMKKAYLDTLYMIYDKRMELYPEDKGYSLGRKGMDQYEYAGDDFTVPYNTLNEAFGVDKLDTDPYVLMRLYMAAMRRLVDKQMEMDQLYDLYDQVATALDHQRKKTTDEKDLSKINKAQEVVDQNFERIAKEDQYIELMKPKVDAEPSNAELLEKITSMMVKRDWLNSDFYLDISEKLYKLKPSTVAAYNLYEGYAKKGKNDQAAKFLEESISADKDNDSKADKLLKLAKLYGADKKYSSARGKAQEAAALKPNWGEPLMYIGDIYMSTSSSCGEDDCSKKYGFWAATDMYQKAKSVDSSAADAASKKLSAASKYYPTAKDCFFLGIQPGQTVTVGGWIGVQTTARFAD
ncbi:MAG: hypothetical protein H6601_00105 [Flavobacteriales bacterium]|nr:hypothetical protein [Flavobacteriales bacterium]